MPGLEERIAQLERQNAALLDAVRDLLEHACDETFHAGTGAYEGVHFAGLEDAFNLSSVHEEKR